MKTRINLLTLLFSLSIFAMFFSSCQKETLVYPLANSKVAIAEPPSSVQSIIITDDEIQKQVSDIQMTYEEALESIDPDVRPDWGVAIKSYTCVRNGETLLVYSPNNPGLNFSDSRRFSVHWFKDGQPVRSNQVRLECMCKGRYAVVVINRATKQGIGIAFHAVSRACYADEVPTTSDGTN